MVVKSNSISTERESEPVRWERIDKIKSLIKGKKNIPVSEDNIDFLLNLLKNFSHPWYPKENSLDGVQFKKFQIWYSFLEDKIILIEGERLDDIQHKNILDKDVLYLGIFNLNQSRKSKKLVECYSLFEYNDSWGMKKDGIKLTDEDSAKKFIVEYLTKRVREKLKLVCKQLVLEDETFIHSGIQGAEGLLTSPQRDVKFIFNTPLSLLKKNEREWMYSYLFFETADPLKSTSNYDGEIKVIESCCWDYLSTFSEEFNQYLSDIKTDIVNMFVQPNSYVGFKTMSTRSELLGLVCNWFRKYFFTEEAGVFYLKDSSVCCENLYFEESKYYSNQIAFIELLGEMSRSSFNSNTANVILGLAEITGELAGGRFTNSVMSTLKLSTSFFFSTGTKGKFVQLLFGKLLESATKDFNKKELERLVYDFQNWLTIGRVGRGSVFLGDAYNKKLILEELDSFIKNKELDKLSEFNLDIDLVYNLTSKNNSITFGHSTVDLAILKSISNNIPVKIGGSLFIRLEFETILKLLIDEVDFNYQSTMDHIKIIKEIRENNPGKVKVILENSQPEFFSKQIDYLRVGIENGIYDEFEKPKTLLEFVNLILELMKN